MRIFKNAWFCRFAQAEGISDESLREAIHRAERGLVDARLGGELIKQRISRPGQGRSGGYRTIVVFRPGHRAVCVYGYAKNRRGGIRPDEEAQFRRMAAHVLALTDSQLNILIARGAFEEVIGGANEVSD